MLDKSFNAFETSMTRLQHLHFSSSDNQKLVSTESIVIIGEFPLQFKSSVFELSVLLRILQTTYFSQLFGIMHTKCEQKILLILWSSFPFKNVYIFEKIV